MVEGQKRILIIDDEPDFIETMRFFLENSNFHVMGAVTPSEGLEKSRENPDLIMLDLVMPQMNGHEVCKLLKSNPLTQNIPIVMITAHARTLDKVEAFNLGAVDYIGKHFSYEEILARIKAVLREHAPVAYLKRSETYNQQVVELRKILDEKLIRTMYQPLVIMSTRAPMGYEALSRGPKDTPLENPLSLFSLATEANMLLELETACLTLSMQRASFIPKDQLLFLNLDPLLISAGYFKDNFFPAHCGISPAQVTIEITERTCIKNFDKLSMALMSFKDLGVKISIDDVGEGYSSLNAIAVLKPEFVKININLVRNAHADHVKSSLIAVIVDLAKRLDSHTVAEGIETEEEYGALCNLGVEYGQGFLFARPCEHP